MLYCIVSSYTSTSSLCCIVSSCTSSSGIVLCCIVLCYRKLQPAVSTSDLAPYFLEEFNENVFTLGQKVMKEGEGGGGRGREGKREGREG